MNELLEQFLSETREVLEAIGEKLMQLESAPDDPELMIQLFRLVHTLKGNSGLFDFPEMTRVLHAGEDLMDAVRNGRVPYTQALADQLLDAMDFVGSLCDDIEGERETPAQVATDALALARKLRDLIGGAALEPEQDAATDVVAVEPGSNGSAAASVALVAAAILRVPEAVRLSALHQAESGAPLFWVHYTPSEECFFQGEDPLHQANLTPGLLWGGIQARSEWPGLGELDAYRCMLDFDVLCSAPRADIQAHYRYVPDQISILALDPLTLALPPGEAVGTQVAPIAAASDARPTAIEAQALDDVIEVQREILSLPDDVDWLLGRIKAVTNSLLGCLRAGGRFAEEPALQSAAQAALQAHAAAPLAQWLDAAFAPVKSTPAAPLSPGLPATRDVEPPPQANDALVPADQVDAEVRFNRRAEDVGSAKSLKVDQSKVDRLMNLIGEMVVAKNAIPYLANRAETVFGVRELSREIKAQYAVINRISEEMQDAIMQVRMMPVSFVMQRFPRLVRDTSRKLGKEVNLVLEGQETSADKNIIESLGDPLVHIVRNSLDHGLEMPDVRLAAGKPAAGTLRITAKQESDRVVIEISDDGKGIDPAVIKQKAYQKGLIDEHTLERISDQDAINLVFAPGFSTAEVVSDLSGRGVGMDVVRTAVERVNGSIALESVKGKGTLLRLSLPLSMAVTNVMIIELDGQMLGVPMDMVVETVRIPRASVRTIKQRLVTVLRERVVPLVALNSLLGVAAEPLANDDDELAALVVRRGEESIALLVDDFQGTAEIILKPLAGVLGGLRAYAGSALMGDGSVLMVLNVKEIM